MLMDGYGRHFLEIPNKNRSSDPHSREGEHDAGNSVLQSVMIQHSPI